MNVLTFFKTRADRPVQSSDPAVISSLYERKRWSVFVSILLGYGLFYTSRMNFSVAKKGMLDEHVMSATQMGLIGSALLFVYSVGKLTNGFLADRSHIARFMSTGLLLSGLANVLLGFNPVFSLFLVVWGLNGWFQSVGSAPSVVALSHWFGKAERGTRYGIWSASHSIGEGLTFVGTAVLVATFGWRWGFWGPGLVCFLGSLVLYRTLADRPPTYGLPPISQYKHEPPEPRETASVGQLQWEVMKHPGVWILALASGCLYVGRYGMGNWGPLYLQTVKAYSATAAGTVMAAYPMANLVGSVSSGFVSDYLFGSRRSIPAFIYGLLEVLSLLALYWVPPGHPFLDSAILAVFGFGMGGLLVYLGGLMAIDLVSRRAAGAAMGLVGLFSYLVAGIQDTLSGYLLDASKVVHDGTTTYSFRLVFEVWLGALVLSMLLAASLSFFTRRPKESANENSPDRSCVCGQERGSR
jgi:MFS transporter, OPA family, sugar phosphate sensor protein UhpC